MAYKIADFGFARSIGGVGAKTHCGTEKYMAPEIISNSYYGISVDIWALGVLFYFMLFAEYPFKGKINEMQVTTWRLKSSEDVRIHPFRLLAPWLKRINWRSRRLSLKIFSSASLWWIARNVWLSRTSWNTLFLNNTKMNLRIILSFTKNWRKLKSIKKIKSMERSMAWIARWSHRMNRGLIFWRRKWLVPSQSICNVSLKKFSSKSARHSTWRSAPLNFSIIMHHIWPMLND